MVAGTEVEADVLAAGWTLEFVALEELDEILAMAKTIALFSTDSGFE